MNEVKTLTAWIPHGSAFSHTQHTFPVSTGDSGHEDTTSFSSFSTFLFLLYLPLLLLSKE